MTGVREAFDLTGRVALITGGAGLLGRQHGEAIAELGGVVVLLDVDGAAAGTCADEIAARYGTAAIGLPCDVTSPASIEHTLAATLANFGRVDILVNNAAHNPKAEPGIGGSAAWSRLETLSLETWNNDLAVGLTGAFLCSQIVGAELARRGKGVILNVCSDLSVIAPDQRIYRQPGLADDAQPVKPVTYSVVKAGLLGLTRYLATYWARAGVRSNAILPGGVQAGQDEDFVHRLSQLIPLERMAQPDEYRAAVVFLVSDASSYMTGAGLVIDGGRTAW